MAGAGILSVTACSQQLSPNGICVRALLHEPEKLFRLEGLMQRGVSSDFRVVGSDETDTLLRILLPKGFREYQTFSTVWVLPYWFKVLCIRQYQVIGTIRVESEGLFVVARRIHRMACLHEETRPDFPYRLFVVNPKDSHKSDSSCPLVNWRNIPIALIFRPGSKAPDVK